MSRALKIGLGGVVVVIAVVVAVVVFVVSGLDGLIKSAVETYGSEATKAKVSLAEVEISAEGTGAIRGLSVGNPAGFETPTAFELGGVSVKLDVTSVTGDTIVINEILIDKPAVTYEMGDAGNNIDALKKNVEDYAGVSGGGQSSSGGGGDDGGEGPKLVIETLRITGGMVNVSHALLKGKSLSAPLPTIELNDIGKDSGGASPAEVIEQVFAAVSKNVGGAVGTLNLDKVLGDVGGTAKKAVEGVLQGTDGAAGGAGDAIKKGTESIGGTLKGLLPKSD